MEDPEGRQQVKSCGGQASGTTVGQVQQCPFEDPRVRAADEELGEWGRSVVDHLPFRGEEVGRCAADDDGLGADLGRELRVGTQSVVHTCGDDAIRGQECASVADNVGACSGKPAAAASLDGLMKVVAETVGSDDEEDLKLLPVALVYAPVADLDAVGFEFLPGAMNVRD